MLFEAEVSGTLEPPLTPAPKNDFLPLEDEAEDADEDDDEDEAEDAELRASPGGTMCASSNNFVWSPK